MAKPRKGKSPQVDTREADLWLNDGIRAAPRADIETPDARRGRQRFIRAYVYTASAMAPVLALGYIAMLPGWFEAQDAILASHTSEETSLQAKQAAMQKVNEWLASDPAPLPGGRLISWDGVKSSAPSTTVGTGDNEEIVPGYEVHTFTLGTGGTAYFTANLQVTVDETLGVYVQGNPSLEPVSPSALDTAEPWPGANTDTPSEPVIQAATSWAEAFTSGDSGKLGLLTGDPDEAHSYQPMTGAKGAANIEATTTALRTDGYTVVRVSFTPLWDVPAPVSADPAAVPMDPAEAAPITYDLLVDKADTASPVVVAWGGPGGVEDLQPYQNALVGIDLSDAQLETGKLLDPEAEREALEAATTQQQAGAEASATTSPGAPTAPTTTEFKGD